MAAPIGPVRPVRTVLEALDVALPDLGTFLHDLEHPVIVKAQAIPAEVAARQAERIKSLSDRRWYKIKVSRYRGAAADLTGSPDEELLAGYAALWWLGAAGVRQNDSPQHDFYARLVDLAHAAGPNTCSTDFMLPGTWDLERLAAEAALLGVRILKSTVRSSAAQSLRTGDIVGFTIGETDVRVRVAVLPDGQAYLAVGAINMADPNFYALLLSSFPNISVDDWVMEPGPALQLPVVGGELLYSTMLTPEVQTLLLDLS